MANIKKMMEAFDHFVNNEPEKAKESYRQYFVESAQEINRDLDASMEEEDLTEAFGDEDLDLDLESDESDAEAFADDTDESTEVTGDTKGEWSDVKDRFEDLETLFAEFADELDQYGEVSDHEDIDGVDDESEGDMFGADDEFADEDSMMEGAELSTKGSASIGKHGSKVSVKAEKGEVSKSVAKDGGSNSSIKARKPVQTKEANVTGTSSGTTPDGTVKGSALKGTTNVKTGNHNNVVGNTKKQFNKVTDSASKKDTYSDSSAKSVAKQNNK